KEARAQVTGASGGQRTSTITFPGEQRLGDSGLAGNAADSPSPQGRESLWDRLRGSASRLGTRRQGLEKVDLLREGAIAAVQAGGPAQDPERGILQQRHRWFDRFRHTTSGPAPPMTPGLGQPQTADERLDHSVDRGSSMGMTSSRLDQVLQRTASRD